MANQGLLSLLSALLLTGFVLNCNCQERKLHVVYMGERPQGDAPIASMHHSMLQNVLGSASTAKESLIYSYGRSFNGFAAKLTDEEVAKFAEMEGVISVVPNHKLKLHTTRSWEFMGLRSANPGNYTEGDVIVGVLDTGIWPESESFSDKNMGPPPAKWKGTCQGNFTCNNKIIGARYYNSEGFYDERDIKSPRDSVGHGSHTASTAAGVEVAGVSYYGLAEGVARGGVPGARIAVYKVCWVSGCDLADILAGFDDAIADGVDIISVSLGSEFPTDYFEDPIAIGSFHAMKNGILTSNSAGNSGPISVTVSNFAPWSLTVAASTIDRKFISQVVLGNGQVFNGLSVNSFDLNGTSYSLIYGGDAANYTFGSDPIISSFCIPGAMNSQQVGERIVLCEAFPDGSFNDGSAILLANGAGAILTSVDYFDDFAFSYPLPVTVISKEDRLQLLEYIRSAEYPSATILVAQPFKDVMAPIVISFSSRGPNPISPDILKPDITAPGVDILAAWSPVAPPSLYEGDTRSVNYNIISGTSMSCPHASGAAAYVKAAHPDWSPAAIKSALMTTAFPMDPTKHRDREFAYGSGHINPARAVNPGLVFDASEAEYVNFLCKQGYNTTTLRLVTGDNSSCDGVVPGRGWDLNYPSFALYLGDGEQINGVFKRTVTNVGPANSTYTANADMFGEGININITVEPSVLSFSAVGEKKSFTVTVTGPKISQKPIISGYIAWGDQEFVHWVYAPLVVYNYVPLAPYNLDNGDAASSPKANFGGPSMFGKKGINGHK